MRLCLVHGFTQTGASWGPIANELRARGYDVLTPDVAGHGRASDVRADLWGAAEVLAREVREAREVPEMREVREAREVPEMREVREAHDAREARVTSEAGAAPDAVWVGYSLGGRVVLHLALAHPALVERLVLVSTTAGIADDGERVRRRHEDEDLAAELERDGVAAFVERWLEGPLWATLPRDRAGVEHRLANTPAGLASSLRLAGTGTQAPLWPRLAEVTAPVLVVTGEEDTKFTSVGRALVAALPQGELLTVPETGHAVPWERPEAFVDAVDGWLTRSGSPR